VVEGAVMRLSRAAASNAAIFRAPQAEAEAKGLALEVEPLREAPFNGRLSDAAGNDGSAGSL